MIKNNIIFNLILDLLDISKRSLELMENIIVLKYWIIQPIIMLSNNNPTNLRYYRIIIQSVQDAME